MNDRAAQRHALHHPGGTAYPIKDPGCPIVRSSDRCLTSGAAVSTIYAFTCLGTGKAAAEMGISLKTIYNKLNKLAERRAA